MMTNDKCWSKLALTDSREAIVNNIGTGAQVDAVVIAFAPTTAPSWPLFNALLSITLRDASVLLFKRIFSLTKNVGRTFKVGVASQRRI
jgi:hypothetical protein